MECWDHSPVIWCLVHGRFDAQAPIAVPHHSRSEKISLNFRPLKTCLNYHKDPGSHSERFLCCQSKRTERHGGREIQSLVGCPLPSFPAADIHAHATNPDEYECNKASPSRSLQLDKLLNCHFRSPHSHYHTGKLFFFNPRFFPALQSAWLHDDRATDSAVGLRLFAQQTNRAQ